MVGPPSALIERCGQAKSAGSRLPVLAARFKPETARRAAGKNRRGKGSERIEGEKETESKTKEKPAGTRTEIKGGSPGAGRGKRRKKKKSDKSGNFGLLSCSGVPAIPSSPARGETASEHALLKRPAFPRL